jgi:hypothetical protein
MALLSSQMPLRSLPFSAGGVAIATTVSESRAASASRAAASAAAFSALRAAASAAAAAASDFFTSSVARFLSVLGAGCAFAAFASGACSSGSSSADAAAPVAAPSPCEASFSGDASARGLGLVLRRLGRGCESFLRRLGCSRGSRHLETRLRATSSAIRACGLRARRRHGRGDDGGVARLVAVLVLLRLGICRLDVRRARNGSVR